MKLFEEFKLYENMWDSADGLKSSIGLFEKQTNNPVYSGSLRAYAYFGGTPKNKYDNDHVNYNAPYMDVDAAGRKWDDDYIFSGTREEWIRKLNKIAKHHKIVELTILDEQRNEVFLAYNADPETGNEFDDIVCLINNLFSAQEPFMKQFASNKSALAEARRKNPTPPTAIKIVKIEPKLQEPYDNPTRHFRHYDEIIYIDPIFNTEMKTSVWEEQPGFGNYFCWGAKHSGQWDYAAYSYEGKLLPDINPTGHIDPKLKAALSDIVDQVR